MEHEERDGEDAVGMPRASAEQMEKRRTVTVKARKPPARAAECSANPNPFASVDMTGVIPGPQASIPVPDTEVGVSRNVRQGVALDRAFKTNILSRMTIEESVVSWENALNQYLEFAGAQQREYHAESPAVEVSEAAAAVLGTAEQGNAFQAFQPAVLGATVHDNDAGQGNAFQPVLLSPQVGAPVLTAVAADDNQVVPADNNAAESEVLMSEDDGWKDLKVLEQVAFWCLQTVKGQEEETFVKRALGKLRLQQSTATNDKKFRMLMHNKNGIKVLVNTMVTGDMKVDYVAGDSSEKWLDLGFLSDGVMGNHCVRAKSTKADAKQLYDELKVMKAKA